MNSPIAPSINRCFKLAISVLLVAGFSGCGKEDIKSYSVPKEQTQPMAQATPPTAGSDMAATPAAPQLKWKLPDGWKEMPPGQMRVASFKVTGKDGKQADVSVIPLPGAAGGDFSNVNRWRGQVGLQPISEAELAKLAQPVELAGQPAQLYEQNGEAAGAPTRILAVIQHRDDMAWFFKMTGSSDLVAQEKSAFIDFLKSFQFPAGGVPAELPPGHPPMGDSGMPPGHPDISATPPGVAAPAAAGEGKPQWSVPAGWKEVSGGQFLVAKFVITGEGNAQAAVNISSSAGNGGGLAANVNRWRKQLGLEELSSDDVAKSAKSLEGQAGQSLVVEMSGTDARSGQPAALVGAMVFQPEHAWFYKLMGSAPIVAAQKDAFLKFVQETKY